MTSSTIAAGNAGSPDAWEVTPVSEDREYYDELEVRIGIGAAEPPKRAICVRQIAHAKANAPYYRELLADVDPAAITTREALARLPITRKSDLKDIQTRHPPFGGLNGWDVGRFAHIYQSPGPIYEPDSDRADHWRFARSLWAAGVRPGMIVHNTFSYHLTPAGMIIEFGRARHRMSGHSRRRRQHRAAGAGDRRSAPRRVLRHAVVPEDSAGEGPRNRRRHVFAEGRRRRRRGFAAIAAQRDQRSGRVRAAELWDCRSRAGRLRKPGHGRHDRRRRRGAGDCAARNRRSGA